MSDGRDKTTHPKAPGRLSAPELDPDATVSGPIVSFDPDQTVSLKGPAPGEAPDPAAKPASPSDDPDATVSGPVSDLFREPQPNRAAKPALGKDDPDATFSGPLSDFDPDATVSSPGGARRRANPFAPRALPEALQANLAALGGLNPLIAFANPILSAVPQIRAAQNHPDPALLLETLQDLIEAFEAGASKAGTSAEVLEASIYSLCCLADDAAGSTAWGRDWVETGLLQRVRGENKGGEEFFRLLQAMTEKPDANTDLLELFYVCLALGLEGRYRGVENGQRQLDEVRSGLHALVTRRRGRPAGLSVRWKGLTAAPVPRAAKQSVAPAATGFPWRIAIAGAVGLLVLVLGYRAMQQPAPVVLTSEVAAPPKLDVPALTPQPAPAPAPVATPHQGLEKEFSSLVQAGLVTLTQDRGRSIVSIRDTRQFPSAGVEPVAEVRSVIGKIGEAL